MIVGLIGYVDGQRDDAEPHINVDRNSLQARPELHPCCAVCEYIAYR